MSITGALPGVVSLSLTFTVLKITAAETPGDRGAAAAIEKEYNKDFTAPPDNVCMSLQVNYRFCVPGGRLSKKERRDKSFILCTMRFFYFSPLYVAPPCFFHLLSFNMLHETGRNIISHRNSGDRPDLWLPTSLQPSLAGQGSGAKAINHTQTIHVGGTQLHCSKNEKKTHSETDRRLKATPSITLLEAP